MWVSEQRSPYPHNPTQARQDRQTEGQVREYKRSLSLSLSHTHTHTHTLTHTCMHKHTHVCMRKNTHTHRHADARTHTHTHAHTIKIYNIQSVNIFKARNRHPSVRFPFGVLLLPPPSSFWVFTATANKTSISSVQQFNRRGTRSHPGNAQI